MSRLKDPDYPTWVCDKCGQDYGTWYKKGSYVGPPHYCSTYHMGTCGVCGSENVAVTEPRDYGHLSGEWKTSITNRKNGKT